MRRFLLYLIEIGIPVILLICSINLIITPEVIYKCDYMDKIIDMARQGYNATNIEPNLDERIFKKKYAQILGRKFLIFCAYFLLTKGLRVCYNGKMGARRSLAPHGH